MPDSTCCTNQSRSPSLVASGVAPEGARQIVSTYIMVKNNSTFPVHAALSWDGIQQQCHNDIPPGSSRDFVVGLGWHDLTVLTATPQNRFDPKRNNDLTRLLQQAVVVFGVGALLATADTFALGVLPPGKSRGEVTVDQDSLRSIKLHPVTATRLYAPDAWTVTVTGNKVDAAYDAQTDQVKINSISPLQLACYNRDSKKTHHVRG